LYWQPVFKHLEWQFMQILQRKYLIGGVVLGLLLAGGGFFTWWIAFSRTPFSQADYDEGYYMAFQFNSTGPGWIDFSGDDWSVGEGFDAGKADFDRIYKHPNVAPFSYHPADRLREVIEHIKKSTILEPMRKQTILEQLEADLADWESSEKSQGGK